MTTTNWYGQNHANNSSSDKSPLRVWSLGDTKHSEENRNVLFVSENVSRDFREKMSMFGASATQNIPRRIKMSCS
jgi:hypothetical protein